ncbi:MAG: hypothetical protein H0U85_06790 [Gemmatimonadales bacterium]|nr:hypothetical protein [Gemmatimonadales bacterium]
MGTSSLANIRLQSVASLGMLAAALTVAPPVERGETIAFVTGLVGMGLIATAILLAIVAWRATNRAGTSVDRLTRWVGRAPAFVLAAVTLAAVVSRIARLVGLA